LVSDKLDDLRHFITARSELREVLFLALSVTFLFVHEISRKPLNGFATNSHGRRIGPSLGWVWRSRSISAARVCFQKHLCSSFVFFL